MAGRFDSLEELKDDLSRGHSYNLSYKDQDYFLDGFKGKIYIATNHQNKDPVEFDTFDDLLDTYKIDGIVLREVIMNFDVLMEF